MSTSNTHLSLFYSAILVGVFSGSWPSSHCCFTDIPSLVALPTVKSLLCIVFTTFSEHFNSHSFLFLFFFFLAQSQSLTLVAQQHWVQLLSLYSESNEMHSRPNLNFVNFESFATGRKASLPTVHQSFVHTALPTWKAAFSSLCVPNAAHLFFFNFALSFEIPAFISTPFPFLTHLVHHLICTLPGCL